MARSKKDKFAALDSDFKDAVAQSSPDEIRKRVAQIALDNEALLKAKEEDEDLHEKLEVAKDAGEVYREGTKMNRLRIQFCQRVLEDKGAGLDVTISRTDGRSVKLS